MLPAIKSNNQPKETRLLCFVVILETAEFGDNHLWFSSLPLSYLSHYTSHLSQCCYINIAFCNFPINCPEFYQSCFMCLCCPVCWKWQCLAGEASLRNFLFQDWHLPKGSGCSRSKMAMRKTPQTIPTCLSEMIRLNHICLVKAA